MVDRREEEVVLWHVAVVGQGRLFAKGAWRKSLGPRVSRIYAVDNVSGEAAEVLDEGLVYAVTDEDDCFVGQATREQCRVDGLLGWDGALGVG